MKFRTAVAISFAFASGWTFGPLLIDELKAQVCNSPSGFVQSFGNIPIGNILVLGPDCTHIQDGGLPGGGANILSFPVQLFNGLTNFGNLTNGSQNVIQYQGAGNSLTTSIHLNPGPGTLPTGTITEYVTERTNLQGFGGNYGRWSYSNLGSAQGNISGIFGEFGGTTATGAMGPYLWQNGVENPPATFTVTEFMRGFTTAGGSEDNALGTVAFGLNTTIPRNTIALNISNIGSPGTRDSHALLWEGKANDGTERAVWWRQKINTTSNAGASTFLWQKNLNGAGWTTQASLTDGGLLTTIGGIVVNSGLSDQIQLLGAASGRVSVSAIGSDTNIPIDIISKGGGDIQLNGQGSNGNAIARFQAPTAGVANGYLFSNALTGLGPIMQCADLGGTGNANIDCNVTMSGTGKLNVNNDIQTGVKGVGSLPTCNAARKGARFFVNDNNTAIAYHAVVTAGGALNVGVTCDGTSWYQS